MIGQVQYPLTDRTNRYPMPAGGLFSSATDLARFYQMLANDGQLVQHAGFPGKGGESQEAFRRAALETFGK